MNKIVEFDDIMGVVTCEAGVILQQLETYLEERGYTVPVDLGAKGKKNVIDAEKTRKLPNRRKHFHERWRVKSCTLWLPSWICTWPYCSPCKWNHHQHRPFIEKRQHWVFPK